MFLKVALKMESSNVIYTCGIRVLRHDKYPLGKSVTSFEIITKSMKLCLRARLDFRLFFYRRGTVDLRLI